MRRSWPPIAADVRSPRRREPGAGPARPAENAGQFTLLIAVNVFVGAMVGLERTTLPLVGREDFGLASSATVLSFIVAFGIAKALTNLGAGALAPSWDWIVAADVLLGINQGLAWSMTVVMKIDLVGPRRRGFALGLNESAGYGGLALAAGLSGWLAAEFAARDVLVVSGASPRSRPGTGATASAAAADRRRHARPGRGARPAGAQRR